MGSGYERMMAFRLRGWMSEVKISQVVLVLMDVSFLAKYYLKTNKGVA
jgi:hypothetical protein